MCIRDRCTPSGYYEHEHKLAPLVKWHGTNIRQHQGSTHASGGDNSADLSLYLANVIHVAAENSLVAGTPSGYY